MARKHWTTDELHSLREQVMEAVARAATDQATASSKETERENSGLMVDPQAGLSSDPPRQRESGAWAFVVVMAVAVVGVIAFAQYLANTGPRSDSIGTNRYPTTDNPPASSSYIPDAPQQEAIQAAPPPPAVQFSIANNTSSSVNISFYDGDSRQQIDPLGSQVYIHQAQTTLNYSISCAIGQKICYSAVKQGNGFSGYWGVGHEGKESCNACCLTCPGGPIVKTLNEYDARQPVPNVTFAMTNGTDVMLSVAFYSQKRAQYGWPDWNRNWSMHIGANSFSLTCQPGEKICYGAWVYGTVNGLHWGVGPFSRFPCRECCVTCDGSTHVIPPLVTGYQGSE
jgi:hypothetical protein